MSRLSLLNFGLRHIARPFLARTKTPAHAEADFRRTARFAFLRPRGLTFAPVPDTLLARITCGPVDDTAAILYFHGGGYVAGSAWTHRAMLGRLSKLSGLPVFAADYRLAQDAPFPAQFEDAQRAWTALTDQMPADRIVLGGDSAGGGLALALLAVLLAEHHPLPAGVFAFSPLTDVSYSGASVRENAAHDVVLPAERVLDMTAAFIGTGDRTDPRASPLFADFTGAPPIWLVAGDTEILLDDTRRMATRLREQGVAVDATIERDLPHVWPIFHNLLPEARKTLRDLGAWIGHQAGHTT